jgi:hypothetical protein
MSMKNEKWEGREVETDSVALVNEGNGRPIILRNFEFKVPPTMEKWPSIEELRGIHQPAVEGFLWKDDLVLVEDLRIILDKDKKSFNIFATCQPRKGAELRELPKTLQDVLKKNDTRGDK